MVAGQRLVGLQGSTFKDRMAAGVFLADDVVRVTARYDPIWEPLRRVEIDGKTYRIESVDVDNRSRVMTIGARREG